MLLASRDIVGGIAFAQAQDPGMSAQDMNALMEQEKSVSQARSWQEKRWECRSWINR